MRQVLKNRVSVINAASWTTLRKPYENEYAMQAKRFFISRCHSWVSMSFHPLYLVQMMSTEKRKHHHRLSQKYNLAAGIRFWHRVVFWIHDWVPWIKKVVSSQAWSTSKVKKLRFGLCFSPAPLLPSRKTQNIFSHACYNATVLVVACSCSRSSA